MLHPGEMCPDYEHPAKVIHDCDRGLSLLLRAWKMQGRLYREVSINRLLDERLDAMKALKERKAHAQTP